MSDQPDENDLLKAGRHPVPEGEPIEVPDADEVLKAGKKLLAEGDPIDLPPPAKTNGRGRGRRAASSADDAAFLAGAVDANGKRRRSKRGSKRAPTSTAAADQIEIDVARRFVREHGEDVRYCPSLKLWLVWDGTRWARDELERVRELAKGVSDELRVEAAKANDEQLWRFARKMGEARGIRAMLELARSDPKIAIRASDLDADPMLLNCPNGTLDLRTGELHEHRREDLITKLAGAPYVAGASSELWRSFLASTFGADDEDDDPRARGEQLAAFVQRAAGYSLTGDTSEEKCFLALGEPRAGKGTFFGAIAAVLGDYARGADVKTFLADKHDVGDRGRPDLVRLIGARFVVTSEMKRGARLDEARIKGLTGRDPLVVRDFRKGADHFIEAIPTFKLWFFANDPPRISDDDAIWTRVLRIPFVRPPAKPDPEMKARLTTDPEELAAVLAWAVEGALAWQRHRLEVPDVVRESTVDLRSELDSAARFVRECVVFLPMGDTSSAAVQARYERWCRAEGEHREHPRSLARALEREAAAAGAKVESHRGTKGARTWRGIVLAGDERSDERSDESPDERSDPDDFADF